MPRRIRGRVSRFGGKGFGFIESRELDRDAWFHVRLMRDIEAIPEVRDVVEFDVLVLPDGRVQAHDVAPAGSGPRPEAVFSLFNARATTPVLRSSRSASTRC